MKRPAQTEDTAPLAGSGDAEGTHHDDTRTRRPGAIAPPWRRAAPAGTSKVATARIESRAPSLRDQVMGFLISRGAEGATDEEGELALGIKPQMYTPRRRELVKLGVVGESGRRRRTDAGRPAAVWVVTSARHQRGDA